MTDNENNENEKSLQELIIDYTIKKGDIRATLLHKLENRFCSSKAKTKFRKEELYENLFSMMKNREIVLLIPDLFEVQWEVQPLKNMRYLKEGNYFVRNLLDSFDKYGLYEENEYYFDSRKLDFSIEAQFEKSIEHLKFLIKKYPKIKHKIIIYYPKGSKPLTIYDQFQGNYTLEFLDIRPNLGKRENEKLEIALDEQKMDLSIIKSYRSTYMCLYITVIEAIQKSILDLQNKEKNEGVEDYEKKLRELVTKWAYHCIMYINSDWVQIKEPSVYRWESFFIRFDIPIKMTVLDFISVKFYGNTFETWCKYRCCIFIKKEDVKQIEKLKSIGYKEYVEDNHGDYIAVGTYLETFIVCPTIEHFYFIFKYVCYYHLFLLLHHSFDYIRKIRPKAKLSERERKLYKVFFPVMQSLFGIKDEVVNDRVDFKYYTYDSRELELIYNKYLLNNVKKIEKKMFSYFLMKYNL